ncbi:MAG TPA: Hsp20/alpha crystallin family protein [Actinomycetota bacterium]|jgi:HSP20 family protein|nr:Hsp20/alpha crystallin family protein [Actinomycetota bacterium]
MALARWVPFETFNEPLESLVRRTFGDFGSTLLSSQGAWAPALDAKIEGEELHVRLELPGIDPDADVDIEVENGVLRVSGERRDEQTSESDGWHRREMRYGSFERRVALPEGVDASSVRANYDAGILHITVPLPAEAKTKVKIGVGNAKELKS